MTDFAHRLYVGDVMHMRLRPFAHKFRYRVFTALLDIDALDTARSRLFAVNGFGLFSFHERDHGPRDGGALRPWAERMLAEAGRDPSGTVMLRLADPSAEPEAPAAEAPERKRRDAQHGAAT